VPEHRCGKRAEAVLGGEVCIEAFDEPFDFPPLERHVDPFPAGWEKCELDGQFVMCGSISFSRAQPPSSHTHRLRSGPR
jgi:hypothetical protein